MESLAYLVAVLLILLLTSGPILILLTSKRAQIASGKKRGLTTLRRILALIFALVGIFLGFTFIFEIKALFPRLLGFSEILLIIYAINREISYIRNG